MIFLNVKRLPSTLFEIINGAFNIKSAAGGIGAYVISASLKEGYARGLLSNEAGAGTSAMAQTRGGGRDPVQTGLLGMCEVFFDTVVLCTLTGLAVLTSGVSLSSRSGIEIVLSAVAVSFGDVSRIIVFVLVLLFAYSTVICWYYYGGECILYLFGNGKSRIFTVVYILAVLLGAFIPSDNIIIFTDYLLFFLCILTALALIKNSERIFSLSERYGLLKKSKHSDVGEKSVSARCNR